MKDLFISKGSVAYGEDDSGTVEGSWDVDTMIEGSMAWFDSTGVFLTDNPAIGTKDFYLVLQTANGIKKSVLIDKNTLTYTKTAYAAPVATVKYLGSDEIGANANGYSLNLPSTVSAGDTYGVAVIDKTKAPNDTLRSKTYSLTVVSGDVLTGLGASNIITKLVALINADDDAIVTAVATDDASNNNDGIQFTADTAGNDFTIAVSDGILDDADVVEYLIVNRSYDATTQSNSGVTVLNEIGTGTAAQLLALETDLSTRDGNTRSPLEGSYMWSATSSVVTDETYVVYALEFYRPQDNILVRENNPKQVLYVACPTSETNDDEDIYETDLILADAIS